MDDENPDEYNSEVALALNFKSVKYQRKLGIAIRLPRKRLSARIGTDREDPYRWDLSVYHILDNDQFSTFESLIVQNGVSVCYMPKMDEDDKDLKKLKLIFESQYVELKQVSKSSFKVQDMEQDIARLVGKDSLSGYKAEIENEITMRSLSCLVNELDLMSISGQYGSYILKMGDLTSHMLLDAQAVSALNLLPEPSKGGNEQSNLLGLLNRGKTAMGKRLLERWIRQPLLDIKKLNARHDTVQVLINDTSFRMELLQEGLKLFPDFDRLGDLLEKQKYAKLNDLVIVYDTVKGVLPRIYETLKSYDGEFKELIKEKFTDELATIIEDFEGYKVLIEEVVDLDSRPNIVIHPKHDEELSRLGEELLTVQENINECHENAKSKINSDIKCDKDKLRGYVFRLTDKKTEAKLSKMPGIHICQILTNGIHFTTPELKSLAKDYKELGVEYEHRQAYLVKSALKVAATYVPIIEAASKVIAELDVLVGFAEAACHAGDGYCRPKMTSTGQGEINIINSRHPCVEMQDNVTFIPNDYFLDHEKSRFQLLTGPNMGGKSTYIRQLGVIVVMAQIGSFVPAMEASIPITHKILVRVGAGDSQQRGISTFMAEMLEASSILQCANSSSLVIIDELGRGTSTYDGFGLAWAISDYIVKQSKAFCLFATHFHELTTLAHSVSGVVNKHVTAQEEDEEITMLYEVKEGPCLKSFGIPIARLASFPECVIEEAKQKAKQLENFDMDDSPSDSKRRRKEQNALSLLDQFAALPADSMDDETFQQVVENLVIPVN